MWVRLMRLGRANAVAIAGAAVGLAGLAWTGLYGYAWTDYETEAQPALHALTQGHVGQFLSLAPAYGGSFILRAPFALAPGLWGGGDLAVYRMVALPCLLCAGALGVWLVARMRRFGAGRLARGCALGLCVASPVALRTLEIGHPEEIMGAALCVAALLLATDERPLWAGLLLGLAVATKAWALLAVGPVLLALPSKRSHALAVAVATAAVVLAPLALAPSSHYLTSSGVAAQTGTTFQPWQAWWWFGSAGHVVRGTFGNVKPGYRLAPGWLSGISHPLIVMLALPLSLLWLRRRAGRPAEPMALLALLMLLRCLLDPWNNVYYSMPFLLALLALEVHHRRDVPALAVCATTAVWISFQWLPAHVSPDLQSAAYLAWSVPLAAGLALWLYAPARWARLAQALATTRGGGVPAAASRAPA